MKLRFHVIACAAFSVCHATGAFADDFSKARDLVTAGEPKIQYKQFCSEAPTGDDKAACRIQKVPTIGFLVCQQHELDGTACKTVIDSEIKNLTAAGKAGLATVTFRPAILGPVACYSEQSNECYGYLTAWVSNGKFVNLDDAFEAGNALGVADDVEKYTKASGLKETIKNLQAVAQFMQAGRGKYSRVCDLQGFFLQAGGFVINDIPQIMQSKGTKPVCDGAGMPSYDKTLAGLESLVAALKAK